MADETYEGWAILELMGHRRLAGYVSEAELAGGKFIRIDIRPEQREADAQPVMTQYYSPSAVFSLTPTTEDIARAMANRTPAPVSRFDLGHLLPEPTAAPADDDDSEIPY